MYLLSLEKQLIRRPRYWRSVVVYSISSSEHFQPNHQASLITKLPEASATNDLNFLNLTLYLPPHRAQQTAKTRPIQEVKKNKKISHCTYKYTHAYKTKIVIQ